MQKFTISITEEPPTGEVLAIEHYKRLVTTDDLNWIIGQLDQALTAKRRKRRSTKEPQEIVQ